MLLVLYGIALLLGILLMAKGSDWATDSLVPVANRLGTTNIAVSVILVSVMAGLPEVLVVVSTVLLGYPAIGFGVIVGSVIANIGLMSGLPALIRPLHANRRIILRDGIFALAVAIIIWILSIDLGISQPQGAILLLLFIPYTINVLEQEKSASLAEKKQELKSIGLNLSLGGFQFGINTVKAGVGTLIFGFIVLVLGAEVFSRSLTGIASEFSFSPLFIGLTLGAVGTSLPTILTAMRAAQKGIQHVAISHTLGSNIFTLLVTLGLLALLSPVSIQPSLLLVTIPAMVLLSGMLLVFMVTGGIISKFEGALLLAGYLVALALQLWIG